MCMQSVGSTNAYQAEKVFTKIANRGTILKNVKLYVSICFSIYSINLNYHKVSNMQISLQRIVAHTELYAWAMELLALSFPATERRDDGLQRQVLQHKDYRLCAIVQNGEPVGVVGYWETAEFIYFENFCVRPDKRNRGIGSATLQLLTNNGKRFILEIEPPVDELTCRRKAFYERNGMVANVYDHIQPHYRATDPDLHLVVMSFGCAITPKEYATFRKYLDENVDVR